MTGCSAASGNSGAVPGKGRDWMTAVSGRALFIPVAGQTGNRVSISSSGNDDVGHLFCRIFSG